MNQVDYHHLRRSLVLLAGQRSVLAAGLVDRVGKSLPELAGRLRGEPSEQLAIALLEAARCALYWQNIEPMLRNSGRDLAVLGVRSRDYDTLAQSWISLLAEMIGEAWDDPLEQAWRSVGREFFDAMRGGHSSTTATNPSVMVYD
ncbi:MAG: hypothetical protein H6851_13660 [Geminicoccaceae bacterium]|nr:hypothetical protein [Geminicoccaceae bacterium]MCB9944650.1 hypothetical protein [Geminicoccaceae bacterium]